MDDRGFTGINQQDAKANIDAFVTAMNDVAKIFQNGGNNLFNNLEKLWCSPKAVEFGDKYSILLYEKTVTAIEDAALSIASKAEKAFDTVSVANGGRALGANYGTIPKPEIGHLFGFLKESGDTGIIGMNVNQVNYALAEYGDYVIKALEALEAVPTNIAFFDPDGAQQATYKKTINDVKNKLEETIHSMLDEIQSAMETEQQTVLTAAQNSASTLQGQG